LNRTEPLAKNKLRILIMKFYFPFHHALSLEFVNVFVDIPKIQLVKPQEINNRCDLIFKKA